VSGFLLQLSFAQNPANGRFPPFLPDAATGEVENAAHAASRRTPLACKGTSK
jgi:hypothetical protein